MAVEIAVKRAGRKLRALRTALGMTSGDVEKKTNGVMVRQQVSRLERGEVERPTMRDLCLLATLYERTPNEFAEWYDYWVPTKGTDEPDHPYVGELKRVARMLPETRRDKLLRDVHIVTVLAQTE